METWGWTRRPWILTTGMVHTPFVGAGAADAAGAVSSAQAAVEQRASESADLAATLQSGVIGNIRTCDGAWCLIDGEGFKGYIRQSNLWGVYPGEKVE